MKICLTSDWHGYLPEIPPCDLLVMAGDYEPNTDRLQSLGFYRNIGRHLRAAPCRHVVMIAGNHDWLLYEQPDVALAAVAEFRRVRYLKDGGTEVDGLRIWGSPWTPPFFDWAFMKPEDELARVYAAAPETVDVLVTHGPPRDVLDRNGSGRPCGSTALLDYVKRAQPRLHVFGHIHEQGGKAAGLLVDDAGTFVQCVNACFVDAGYRPKHPPQVVDVNRINRGGV